ncbi:bombyxin A-3 homolog isoform X2 [Leguminivora glycinivorella]|nr:bombyxin A-3 homolog isoform X2 [Leguminivora glycinivorella]
MKVLILMVFLFTLALCTGHISGGLTLQDLRDPQIYCGRNLAIAISELCVLQKRGQKRSEGTLFGTGIAPYKEDYGWPWLLPQQARTLAPPRGKRLVNGIVDECCNKPCSMEEMFDYCN